MGLWVYKISEGAGLVLTASATDWSIQKIWLLQPICLMRDKHPLPCKSQRFWRRTKRPCRSQILTQNKQDTVSHLPSHAHLGNFSARQPLCFLCNFRTFFTIVKVGYSKSTAKKKKILSKLINVSKLTKKFFLLINETYQLRSATVTTKMLCNRLLSLNIRKNGEMLNHTCPNVRLWIMKDGMNKLGWSRTRTIWLLRQMLWILWTTKLTIIAWRKKLKEHYTQLQEKDKCSLVT